MNRNAWFGVLAALGLGLIAGLALAPARRAVPQRDPRVEELEREVARLKEERSRPRPVPTAEPSAPGPVPANPGPPAPPAPKARDPRDVQATALDATKAPAERVGALEWLRMNAPDLRTREVVDALAVLLETSPDAGLRAEICRHLKKAGAWVKDPMLRRLGLDVDERVREEAGETLGPLRDDPEVRAALERSAQSDPARRVREQCRESLEGD